MSFPQGSSELIGLFNITIKHKFAKLDNNVLVTTTAM